MGEVRSEVIKVTLEKQLELLFQRSRVTHDADLAEISRAMIEIAEFLLKPHR